MSRFIYNLSVNKDSHIITCNEFNYIKNILQLTPNDNININCSLTDLIFTNAKIIDKSRHWSLLLYQWDKSLERTFNIYVTNVSCFFTIYILWYVIKSTFRSWWWLKNTRICSISMLFVDFSLQPMLKSRAQIKFKRRAHFLWISKLQTFPYQSADHFAMIT